ncbi:hypothetical protein C2G38_2089162, partial [Gigaspora rosea]
MHWHLGCGRGCAAVSLFAHVIYPYFYLPVLLLYPDDMIDNMRLSIIFFTIRSFSIFGFFSGETGGIISI